MAQWLISNIGNIIAGAVLAVWIALVIRKLIRNRRERRPACGCGGCESCGMCCAGRAEN